MSSRDSVARCARVLSAAGALAGPLAGPISAGPIEVIYTNLPGHPTSLVPGLPGQTFNIGVTTQFDRPFASPSGQRWIIRARLGPPALAVNNEVVLSGSGRTGTVAVREGSSGGLGAGETFGAIQRSMGINDAGRFVFGAQALSATGARDVIMMGDGAALTMVARDGATAPGTGGGRYSGSLDSAGILNDAAGTPYFRAGLIVLGTREGQSILYRGTQILAATIDPSLAPAGQLNDPSAPWGAFEPGRLHLDAAGANWIVVGTLLPPVGAQVLAVGNSVAAQQDTVLPGDPLGRIVGPSGPTFDEFISHDGRFWMARGAFTNNDTYVLRNGRMVAALGQPITLRPGEAELFGDAEFLPTFFLNTGNSAGDFLIGGVTTGASDGADAVVVLNRQRVVLREGDGIDLDGNGHADDGAFIGIFNNDDAFLTDDRWLYFTADIRNAVGALTGQGFFRLKVCKPDWDGSGRADSSDIAAFLLDWLASAPGQVLLADYNTDGVVDSQDIAAFVGGWFAAVGGC